MKQIIKKLLLHGVFPVYYRLLARRPVRRRNVFLEIRYPQLTDNLQLLHAACRKQRDYRTETFFLKVGQGSLAQYTRRCLAMIRCIADAERIFVDESSNVLSALPIRPETKIIQAWHACGAFKRFGHGLPDGPEEAYYNRYALVTVSAEEVVDKYCESMRQPRDVVRALGVSRTDRFFDPAFLAAARKRVEAAVPDLGGRKLVLYAPTFRGNVAAAELPQMPDIRRLCEALGDKYVFVYRGHPAVKERPAVPRECRDFFRDVTDLLTTEDCLCRADVCITDYSSLVFEFALLERPMLFYVYDIDRYDRDRGFYYPFRSFAPGPICRDTDELLAAFASLPEQADERVRAFRERFMGACDGHATERILQAIEQL